MARLVILDGRHEGKRLRLPENKELTIGRDDKCHLTLRTDAVSREHCVVRCESEDDVFVRDLDSANGTQVNQVAIEAEVRLNHGDLLTIGPVSFRLELASVPKSMQTPPEEFPPPPDDEGDSVDVTENSIAAWLTQGPQADPSSDTAIMKSGDARIPKVDPEGDSTVRPVPRVQEASKVSPLPPASKKFETVAEEAQDIIRRHLEEKKAKKAAKQS